MTKVLLTGGIQRWQYSSLCCYNSEHKSPLTISLALAPASEHYCRTYDCPQPTLQACPTRPGNYHIRRSSALHSGTCSLQSHPSPPAHGQRKDTNVPRIFYGIRTQDLLDTSQMLLPLSHWAHSRAHKLLTLSI